MLGVELKAKQYDKLCVQYGPESRTLLEDWNFSKDRGDQVESVADSKCLIGVWIVCSHGDDKGVPDVTEAIALTKVGRGANFKRAQASWKAFAKWAGKQGVKVGKPQVFLAPTEVA